MNFVIQIEDKIVSQELLNRKFVCDLSKCKGACCVHGDSGAPLELNEAQLLDKLYPKIKSFLRPEGIQAIESQGKHLVDTDGDTVTPLIDGKECAYTIITDEGIVKCGIEKAFLEKKISFRKPISCYLYPVRVKKYDGFSALNYDEWEICKPALVHGEELDVPIYRFVKDALTTAYGKKFYNELEIAAENLADGTIKNI